jgi:Phosphotransferase enzyme family
VTIMNKHAVARHSVQANGLKHLSSCPHTADLSSELSCDSAVSRLGPRIAAGYEADVHLLGESMVLRVERDHPGKTTERALLALRTAQLHGAPVPRSARSITVCGRSGIAMERLESANLLQHLGHCPWLVQSAGRLMGSIHAEIHRISGPVSLPSPQDTVLGQGLHNEAGVALPKPPVMRSKDRKLLHGDFTPANLLRHACSRRWLVVDWGGALSGDPEADVALTLAAIRLGAPPAAASVIVRGLAPVGRRLLASCYLREYLRHGRLDYSAVREWISIWCFLHEAGRDRTRSSWPAESSRCRSS